MYRHLLAATHVRKKAANEAGTVQYSNLLQGDAEFHKDRRSSEFASHSEC